MGIISKPYPTHTSRAYTRTMSHEPALQNPNASLGPAEVIGLFLARLFAHLTRLETSGETFVRADIANMVASAEGLVQSFVRIRASAQLESAGFTDIASAMRTPICSREHAVQINRAQGCESASPAELIAQLKPALEQFEQAETLASNLARIILCAMAFLSPETRRTRAYAPITAAPKNLSPSPVRRAPPPWPPPAHRASAVAPSRRRHPRRRVSTPWIQQRLKGWKHGYPPARVSAEKNSNDL